MCSPELVRRKSANRSVTLIPNAVDAAAYRRPAPRPADLPDGPVALYLGTVHPDRIDVDLCEATARALGEAGTLVLVGPNLLAAEQAARLRDAGARLLGPRPRDEVIGYLQHADVLVVPHVVTEFTDSLDPIKLYEYQAVGRPVVSTPVAGFRDADDPRITIASGDAFAAAVAAAVPAATGFPDGADGPVADWSERVAAMAAVVQRLDPSRGVAPRVRAPRAPGAGSTTPTTSRERSHASRARQRRPPPRLGVVGERGDGLGERGRVVGFNEHTGRPDEIRQPAHATGDDREPGGEPLHGGEPARLGPAGRHHEQVGAAQQGGQRHPVDERFEADVGARSG